jgi:putative (di)nucleoside polyphosphate hydrolase
MFRELEEELGLQEDDVAIIGRTTDWLYYDVPDHYNRASNKFYKGQKQIWYLLRLVSYDDKINLSKFKEQEFDDWRWIDYWAPIHLVIPFKKIVYKEALQELSNLIKIDGINL